MNPSDSTFDLHVFTVNLSTSFIKAFSADLSPDFKIIQFYFSH